MNSVPGSASSDPRPPSNIALRSQKVEGDLVTGCDAHRGGAANRTTRTAERDIRGIGGPHTGLGCLTGPYCRCTVALNPRKESRIPHYRKPEKHSDINYLSRGGGGGIRTHDTIHHRIHAFQACAFSHSATPPQERDRLGRSSAGTVTKSNPGCNAIAAVPRGRPAGGPRMRGYSIRRESAKL